MSGEQMTCKGRLRGHNGWITQIATTPVFPDMLLSALPLFWDALSALPLTWPSLGDTLAMPDLDLLEFTVLVMPQLLSLEFMVLVMPQLLLLPQPLLLPQLPTELSITPPPPLPLPLTPPQPRELE